jgi:hypothetical protein
MLLSHCCHGNVTVSTYRICLHENQLFATWYLTDIYICNCVHEESREEDKVKKRTKGNYSQLRFDGTLPLGSVTNTTRQSILNDITVGVSLRYLNPWNWRLESLFTFHWLWPSCRPKFDRCRKVDRCWNPQNYRKVYVLGPPPPPLSQRSLFISRLIYVYLNFQIILVS